MTDKIQKSKDPLEEMQTLRLRIEQLEKEKTTFLAREKESTQVKYDLGERVKELNCLYGISRLVDQCGNSLDMLLQGTVDILPPSWQYPSVTCGRIIFEKHEFITSNFRVSQWKQSAIIRVNDEPSGSVEVFYLKKKPTIDEGPFLKEERLLINAVGERLGRTIERMRTKQQLDVEHDALQNANVALRQVLARVQDEKQEVKDAVQANVDKVIMPILHALENEVSSDQGGYVKLLKNNLEEIASPFAGKLSRDFLSLTPTEIQICSMIRRGLITKEIAQLRDVSPATINRHREHIRRKLNITNEDINLVTFLNSVSGSTFTRQEKISP